MMAEEYIKGLVTTCGSGEIDKHTDVIEESIALKAIKMARKEEREKADKAFRKVIKGLDVYSPKWYEKMEKYFLELINE